MTQQQPATFTPGPWHVDDYQAGGVCFILASGL